jgi:hypothetical protein
MKTIILASVFVLVVAGTQKGDPKYDPWAKMPTSAMVDDRRGETRTMPSNVRLFWARVDVSLTDANWWR